MQWLCYECGQPNHILHRLQKRGALSTPTFSLQNHQFWMVTFTKSYFPYIRIISRVIPELSQDDLLYNINQTKHININIYPC